MFQTRGTPDLPKPAGTNNPEFVDLCTMEKSGGLDEVRHDFFAKDAHIVNLAVEPSADGAQP
jgi:hypothetical protein